MHQLHLVLVLPHQLQLYMVAVLQVAEESLTPIYHFTDIVSQGVPPMSLTPLAFLKNPPPLTIAHCKRGVSVKVVMAKRLFRGKKANRLKRLLKG